MINKIYPKGYRHVDSVTMNGLTIKSFYNHNYYQSDGGDVIFEVCDDGFFSYYRVTGLKMDEYIDRHGDRKQVIRRIEDHLGNYDEYQFGVFDPDNPYIEGDGSVEVDTDFC